MVRGCQKKIIYLKNTGSEAFDEAYFVLKDSVSGSAPCECDMVSEAKRILDELVAAEDEPDKIYRISDMVKKTVVPFLIGILTGVIITLLIK